MAQRRWMAWAVRHEKNKMFKKGDQVLVFNSRAGKHPGTLKKRWMGPYVIKKEVAPRTLKLENLDWSINTSIVNGHRLKPYYSSGGSK